MYTQTYLLYAVKYVSKYCFGVRVNVRSLSVKTKKPYLAARFDCQPSDEGCLFERVNETNVKQNALSRVFVTKQQLHIYICALYIRCTCTCASPLLLYSFFIL